MFEFVVRRSLSMALTLFAVSIVAFALVQLPPGDFIDSYIAKLQASGDQANMETVERLREVYGLNEPFYTQYGKWMWNLFQGDLGYSFGMETKINNVLWDRVYYSFLIEFSTVLITIAFAVPIGIYSAVKKYSLGDYCATFIGFIGLAIPNFFLALILMYINFVFFDETIGGLFSEEYAYSPWSWGRFLDFVKHVWGPVFVLATGGAAQMIRIMRANLLDELQKPYVETARAKGMSEWRLILKYPVRVALNPLISTMGWLLPTLISSSIVVAIVMNIPVIGPMFLEALISQDIYLGSAFILIIGVMTIFGTFISDIILSLVDPRIRYR